MPRHNCRPQSVDPMLTPSRHETTHGQVRSDARPGHGLQRRLLPCTVVQIKCNRKRMSRQARAAGTHHSHGQVCLVAITKAGPSEFASVGFTR